MKNHSISYARLAIVVILAMIVGVVTLTAGDNRENAPVVSTNDLRDNQDIVANSDEVATTTGATKIGENDYILPDGRGFYSNEGARMSFVYPNGWVVTEYVGPSGLGIHVQGPADGEYISVSSVARDNDELVKSLEWYNWYNSSGFDVNADYGVYAWTNPQPTETDYFVGAGMETLTPDRHTWFRVSSSSSMISTIHLMAESFTSGGFSVRKSVPEGFIEYLKEVFPPQQPVTMGNPCTNCGETDAYRNPYSCDICDFGNCVWKCEQSRIGGNFDFTSIPNQNAFRWMTLEKEVIDRTNAPRYPTGGTIPKVGAVIVYGTTIGTAGHVATITGINSNGSITVREQNCSTSCTIDGTKTPSYLIRHKVGYIYNGNTAPHPTPKEITGAIGALTVIDDYNLTSSVYNFGTYGPGAKMSGVNSGERAWGVDASGLNGCMHFIKSKSGSPENTCIWAFRILSAGVYEVHAYIPDNSKADATSVSYRVGGFQSVAINQRANRGRYVRLVNPTRPDGNWSFVTGATSEVATGDGFTGGTEQIIAADAIRFKRVS